METFVDIISDIGAQISKIKRCRVNQQTLLKMQKEVTANDVTLDALPSLESIKELQTEYTNMLTAIIDLLDGAKYLWKGDHHE